jgi:hydroxyacylglutathione hydrolase
MAQCEVCRNEYDKTMEITREGETHTFDSFECAIHAIAPACEHCGCRIIGHGIEAGAAMFCCAHCAEMEGIEGARDRIGA